VGRNIIPSDSEPLVYVISTWCCVLNAESTNSNFIDLDLTLPCSYISYLRVYPWALRLYHPEAVPTLCQNAPKFSPELWNFSPQVQKRYDYVTKRTRKSIKNPFLFSNRGYNRYLSVYKWPLRLYHPSAPLCNHRIRFRIYTLQLTNF
jgi:hypothetical protein